MSATSEDLDVLDQLAEDFVGRLRRGERPTIQSYANERPKLAAEINRLFPTLVAMEGMSSSIRTAPTEHGVSAMPTKIGDYRIVRSLGAGGMGIVYEAIQESLGRHVALKILPASAHKSERFRERFRVEARAAARLQHAHIVPVYGVGEHEGVPYYAMQFISGRVLDEFLRPRGSSPNLADETVTLASRIGSNSTAIESVSTSPNETSVANSSAVRWVAEIGVQVAGALSYAHGEGVIHRDIKPSNLILDQRGCVWVTDFGLAKITDTDGLTEPGDIVGTIRYMAPERFNGWSDVRSDVYGLGATLYELLTRRPMYDDADRSRLIHAILNSEPPKPRKLNRAIPRDLETIVLKAIAREPGHRYASADALEVDLKRFIEGRPILARRQTLTGIALSWCRRKPLAASMAFAVAILLLVLFAGSLIVNVRLDGQNSQIVTQNQQISDAQAALKEQLNETNEAHAREAEAKVEARRQLMLALRREADAARLSRRPGGRAEALAAIAKIAELAKEIPLTDQQKLELRNVTIASLALLDVEPADDGQSVPAGSHFTPDHRHYVTLDGKLGVRVMNYETGNSVALRKTESPPDGVTFSPDGRFILFRESASDTRRFHRLVLWDWQADKVTLTIEGWFGGWPYAFRGDSAELTLIRNGNVEFYSLTDFRLLRQFKHTAKGDSVHYHPDGETVAMASADNRSVEMRDARTGAMKKLFHLPADGIVMGFSFSADGRFMGIGCSNYRGYVFHTENGQLSSDLFGHHAQVTRIVFDPHGFWVATSGWDNTTRFWNPSTGTMMLNLSGIVSTVSSDGARVVCSKDHQVQLLNVTLPREFRSLHGHVGGKGPWNVAFSSNGRLLTSCSDDGVRLWDAWTGKAAGVLPAGPSLTTLFHPNRKSALTVGSQWIYRWPTKFHDEENLVRIGPKEITCDYQLDRNTERRASMSTDGGRVAISHQLNRTIYVFPFDEANLWRSLGPPQNDLVGAVMSPDGNWVVGFSWPSAIGKVWDTRTNQMVKDIPIQKPSAFAFSPDSRTLVVASPLGAEVLEVGSWKRIATVPPDANGPWAGSPCFSPDGRILALARKTGMEIQFLDSNTWSEIARLQSPDPQPMFHMAFSPDGSKLASTAATRSVRLWDIRAIRTTLSGLDLDWLAPAIANEEEPQTDLKVEVVGK